MDFTCMSLISKFLIRDFRAKYVQFLRNAAMQFQTQMKQNEKTKKEVSVWQCIVAILKDYVNHRPYSLPKYDIFKNGIKSKYFYIY